MATPSEELAGWAGRELLDPTGKRIGTVTGLGFPRRKFGTWWLLVGLAPGQLRLVPVESIDCSRERLVLAYRRGYVETSPAVGEDQVLPKADEPRLALHYGFSNRSQGSQCQACGLCLTTKRAKHRRERSSVAGSDLEKRPANRS